jgi:hypothetical protein
MSQKTPKLIVCALMAVFMICAAGPVLAKVTVEEAARLKQDLTPFGAERAGNAEGTIPAWEGGITAIPEGISYEPGKKTFHPDPFADDKILFTITAQNMDKYAEKLSEGQKALFKKYPDTYKLNVYTTRRTNAAPQWVYDNTYKNALNAEVVETYSVVGAFGGIPFPIPKTGMEALQNHVMRWRGPDRKEAGFGYIIYPDGGRAVSAGTLAQKEYSYYTKDGSIEDWDGTIEKQLHEFIGPARRKGEIILKNDPVDYRGGSDSKTWQYQPGQRRVRRAPSLAFDTPAPAAGGNGNYDDLYMFMGNPSRFDWKLVGKKEMYIPYNSYQLYLAPHDELMTAKHLNPKYMRWELHRVWIVEATLRSDKRHNYGRRVFHLDEDSWQNVLMDNYDTRGNLWRTATGGSKNYYEVPGNCVQTIGFYDLQTDTYATQNHVSEDPSFRGTVFEDIPSKTFTPQNTRKLGLR